MSVSTADIKRKHTTEKEKEILQKLITMVEEEKIDKNEAEKQIEEELRKEGFNWTHRRIDVWFNNNTLPHLKAQVVPKDKPKFPKTITYGPNTFIYNSNYSKKNGEVIGYYKCTNCQKSVSVCFKDNSYYPISPHRCDPTVICQRNIAQQREKIAALEKQDIIEMDDNAKLNLLNKITWIEDEIKRTIGRDSRCDPSLPDDVQKIYHNGKEIMFLTNHSLFPHEILIYSCEMMSSYLKGAKKLLFDISKREVPAEFPNGCLLTILVYNEKSQVFIPTSYIIFKEISEEAFLEALKISLRLCSTNEIELVLADYNTELRKACKALFQEERITGSFYQYSKKIKSKIDKLYMPSKMKTSLQVLFKNFPFIDVDSRNAIFEQLEQLNNENLNYFLDYYKVKWMNNPEMNFEPFTIRVSSACDVYRSELMFLVKEEHPELSKLIKSFWTLFINKTSEIQRRITKCDLYNGYDYLVGDARTIMSYAVLIRDNINDPSMGIFLNKFPLERKEKDVEFHNKEKEIRPLDVISYTKSDDDDIDDNDENEIDVKTH